MSKKNEFIIFVVTTALVSFLMFANVFEHLEVKTHDWRFASNLKQKISDNVVLISITDRDINNFGPWPFKRSVHAQMIDYLKEAGAAVIGFDIIFSMRSDNYSDDECFIKSMEQAGNVILAEKFIHTEELVDTGTIVRGYELDGPHDDFKKAALDSGFINIDFENINVDGVIRNIELVKETNGARAYSLALKIASKLSEYRSGKNIQPEKIDNFISLSNNKIPLFEFYKSFYGERIKQDAYIIKYNGNSRTGLFRNFTYTDIFTSNEKELPRSIFKGKAVLIGVRSDYLPDHKLSPLGDIAGMEINAQIIDNIMNEEYVIRPSRIISAFILILIGFLTYLIIVRSEVGLFDLAYILIAILLITAFSYISYSNALMLFEVFAPITEILLMFIFLRFYQLIENLKKEKFKNHELSMALEKLKAETAS